MYSLRNDALKSKANTQAALKEANRANSKRLAQAAREKPPEKALQIGLLSACLWDDDLKDFNMTSPAYEALSGSARELNSNDSVIYRTGGPLTGISWSKKGQLAISYLRGVKVLDIREPFPADVPLSIDWHHDGRQLAVATQNGVFILDTLSEQKIRISTSAGDGQPRAVSWNPNGDRLAVGFQKGLIKLYTPRSGSTGLPEWEVAAPMIQWQQLHKQEDLVLSLDWSKNINVLAAESSSGSAAIFNVSVRSLGNIIQSFVFGGCPDTEQVCQVFSVRLSPDGHYLAVGSKDGTATVINLADSQERFRLQGGGSADDKTLRAVTDVAWSSDGNYLATATGNGMVRIWDWRHREYRSAFKVDGGGETHILWDPTSNDRIATASRDGIARIWTWQRLETPDALLRYAQKYWTEKLHGSSQELSSQEFTELGITQSVAQCNLL